MHSAKMLHMRDVKCVLYGMGGGGHIHLPPLNKLATTMTQQQVVYAFGLNSKELRSLARRGLVKKAGKCYSDANRPISLFSRQSVERDAFYAKLAGHGMAGRKKNAEAFRESQLRRLRAWGATEKIRNSLRDEFKRKAQGTASQELVQQAFRCLFYTDESEWERFTNETLPALVRHLHSKFYDLTAHALMLIADFKKLEDDWATTLPSDQDWGVLLGAVENFCKRIGPATIRHFEEILARFGYAAEPNKDGRVIYKKRIEHPVLPSLTLQFTPRINAVPKVFFNGKPGKFREAKNLTLAAEGLASQIEDAQHIARFSRIPLEALVNSVYYAVGQERAGVAATDPLPLRPQGGRVMPIRVV